MPRCVLKSYMNLPQVRQVKKMHHARPTIACDLRVKYLLAELTPSFIMPVSFLSPVLVQSPCTKKARYSRQEFRRSHTKVNEVKLVERGMHSSVVSSQICYFGRNLEPKLSHGIHAKVMRHISNQCCF